jgi:TRAP-type mannitol/chloroaromatic compound transport system permease small subunit
MKHLLRVSAGIDRVTAFIGRAASWLVLLTVVISAGNAVVRKAFNSSSNALLEVQWYLFAAVFMLMAAYVFQRNAHVRIDFVSSRLTARARAWVDVFGIVLFVLPLCGLLIDLGWPTVADAWRTGETSPNAGGLVRWPVYALLPAGMGLLLVQSLSELVKRVAFLRGLAPDPNAAAEAPAPRPADAGPA